MADHYIAVHAHFYQPPRGNPWKEDDVPEEPGAEPYHDFNEKVTAECYAPNAALGNFNLISFNLGGTLARWLEQHAPETYAQIVTADRDYRQKYGAGNGLAQPAHHTILPLCNRRDKALQVRWGQMSFEQRFGRAAEGMWLPEMAVDLETLQVVFDSGIKFTVLSQSQLRSANEGAGPYWVKLPSGDRLAVYARDDWHSNQLAFNIRAQGGAGRWARNTLAPLRRTYPRFLMLATDGETFGHHHVGEEHFLHWLLAYEAQSVGFEVTTLERDLREYPPVGEIEIIEKTAWSCWHGLNRWSQGCECTPGDSSWKPALRGALQRAAERLDQSYVDYMTAVKADPWRLREEYFRVRLGQIEPGQLLRDFGLAHLKPQAARKLLALLLSQYHRQRMFVSCTFFYEDLDRAEPRYSVANTLRAIKLAALANGRDDTSALRDDLATVVSPKTGKTGVQLLDDALVWANEPDAMAAEGGAT